MNSVNSCQLNPWSCPHYDAHRHIVSQAWHRPPRGETAAIGDLTCREKPGSQVPTNCATQGDSKKDCTESGWVQSDNMFIELYLNLSLIYEYQWRYDINWYRRQYPRALVLGCPANDQNIGTPFAFRAMITCIGLLVQSYRPTQTHSYTALLY